jgi:hypothetical protein
MRLLLLFISGWLFCPSLSAQENLAEIDLTSPIVKFFETEVDLGESMEGETLEYTFKFVNKGKETLVISNILTSCGCTVVDWSREPIGPGKKGEIRTKFNTKNKIGLQNKTFIVLSNSANYKDEIKLKVNVIPRSQAKATAVEQNIEAKP